MAFDQTKQSTRGLLTNDFHVTIDGLIGSSGVDLEMGINLVDGLNSGQQNIIWHRDGGGMGDTNLTPRPGVSKTSSVTLKGVYLADMGDLKVLQDWVNQVKGQKIGDILGGYSKTITIRSLQRNVNGVDLLAANKSLPVNRQIVLHLAWPVNFKISSFDGSNEAFATWELEVAFKKQEVVI